MKQLKLFILFLAVSSLTFNSCKKDEGPIEYDVNLTTDNTTTVKTGTVSITWTIQVHSARTSGKTSGLSGATVSVVGKDGVVQSATTDANGFATFTDMAQGIASATVKLTSYTTVNITVDLYTALTLEIGEDVTKFATSDVMLWPLDSKIDGVAYANFDGDFVTYPNDTTGDDTRTGMTVYVTAMVGTLPFQNNTEAGQILEYSIEPNYWSSTTASASSGTYSISGLPGNNQDQSLTLTISGQEYIDSSDPTNTWVPTDQDISGNVWPAGSIIRNIQFK